MKAPTIQVSRDDKNCTSFKGAINSSLSANCFDEFSRFDAQTMRQLEDVQQRNISPSGLDLRYIIAVKVC
jgi:hypothetical protein